MLSTSLVVLTSNPWAQFHYVEQADVSLPALDPAYIVPMQLRQLGELLLGKIAFELPIVKSRFHYVRLADVQHMP